MTRRFQIKWVLRFTLVAAGLMFATAVAHDAQGAPPPMCQLCRYDSMGGFCADGPPGGWSQCYDLYDPIDDYTGCRLVGSSCQIYQVYITPEGSGRVVASEATFTDDIIAVGERVRRHCTGAIISRTIAEIRDAELRQNLAQLTF